MGTKYASLQAKYPLKFADGRLRMFQRRGRAWRPEEASAHLERNGDHTSPPGTIVRYCSHLGYASRNNFTYFLVIGWIFEKSILILPPALPLL